MLQILSQNSRQVDAIPAGGQIPKDALWYDLISPDDRESSAMKEILQIHVPVIEEMREIEESSRLYKENQTFYMTCILIASAEAKPVAVPITFVLTKNSLLTVRYADPKPFKAFERKIAKTPFADKETLFLGLMDTIIERLADILETNALEIEKISSEIFKEGHDNQRAMRDILAHLGKVGDLNSKVRESLQTIDRQLNFYHNQVSEEIDKKIHIAIQTLQQDVKSLVNYVTFLFGKTDFLLDASLGFVNIEQNAIIKIISVGAALFLPPMLIASIYGMNFTRIPELSWYLGYPFALLLIIISALIPYFYFKRKGWL
jgi:magnesium transporter